METLMSYIGWTIVAAAVAAYGWVFYRFVLFPKMPKTEQRKQETPRAA